VVAEAQDGREAIELAAKHAPDIVLLDLGMAEMNGIEAARRIHQQDPAIGLVALTVHADSRYVTGFFDAGGKGYLLKTCESDELLRAIDAVKKGRTYITPDVAHVLATPPQNEARMRPGQDGIGFPPPDVLTPKGARGPATDRRGRHLERDRCPPRDIDQNRRDPPHEPDAEAGPSQRLGGHQVRDPRGADDAQRLICGRRSLLSGIGMT
jgi:CheY-like chemotaxis protein